MTANVELEQPPITYQGQFGAFTIEETDRQDVIWYRTGLAIAALSLVLGRLVFCGTARWIGWCRA